MKIGVIFCGGCNSRYDRGKAARYIIEKNPKFSIEYAKESETYDGLLVISGCSVACADYDKYKNNANLVHIQSGEESYLLDKFNELLDSRI